MAAPRPDVELAQTNIATLWAPVDDPRIADFVDALDDINALAEASPGFVWRLVGDGNNATDIGVDDNPLTIPNLSVWSDPQALRDYVFASRHREFLRRRTEWFQPGHSRTAMWWVPQGDRPTVADAVMRCDFADRYGPSPFSFGFRDNFPVLTIEPRDLDHPDATALIAALNGDLRAATPEGGTNYFGLDPLDVDGTNGVFVVAYLDGEPVGCGAFRGIDVGDVSRDEGSGADTRIGEVKRMYVAPEARGHKLGAAILATVEHRARQLGFTEARLETGPYLTAAVALYEGVGYEKCEPWGEYRCAAHSVCYRRDL